MRNDGLALIAFAALVAGGCTGPAATSPATSAEASARLAVASPTPGESSTVAPSPWAEPPMSAQSESPSPTIEPLPSGLPSGIATEIELRGRYGLRHDLEWVLAVLGDSRAYDDGFGFTALPEEYEARARVRDRVTAHLDDVRSYGERHSDEFENLYLDWSIGRIMSVWTAHAEEHLAAMLAEAGPDALIAARTTRLPRVEQRRISDAIRADDSWFVEQDAILEGITPDAWTDRLEIEVSSANPDIERLILERYATALGVPEDVLAVLSDGTGVMLLPWGTVKGVVTMPDGSTPDWRSWAFDVREGPGSIGYCGSGDIGIGIDVAGRFEIPCRAGEYTIVVSGTRYRGEGHVIGRADVKVREDETSRVRIRLHESGVGG